jgi:hypothetical protein
MSQLIKQIEADENKNYLFQIALDRIPESEEEEQIKQDIRDTMESLGVPPDRVAIIVFKSDVPPEVDTPQDEIKVRPDYGYLLCILVRSDPGVLQQDPAEISREAVAEFAQFAGLRSNQVAAVVLENAYLEVKTRSGPSDWGDAAIIHSGIRSRWDEGSGGPTRDRLNFFGIDPNDRARDNF